MDALKGGLLRELGDDIKRAHRKEIETAIRKFDQAVRIADDSGQATYPIAAHWNEITNLSETQLSISGSQSLAFCAQIFAYECFLVACFESLGGDTEARPSGQKFWAEFKRLLGGDPRATYWDDRPVFIAREARNSIAHRGGKAKPELLAADPSLFISPEGIISVRPTDNHELFAVLKSKVSQLLAEVTPRLASAT
ncbi:MAG: hypothetical protein U0792_21165 [Gemmataceae bacterium]